MESSKPQNKIRESVEIAIASMCSAIDGIAGSTRELKEDKVQRMCMLATKVADMLRALNGPAGKEKIVDPKIDGDPSWYDGLLSSEDQQEMADDDESSIGHSTCESEGLPSEAIHPQRRRRKG